MSGPVLGRANIAYELSARTKATGHGGIGAIAKLIGNVGDEYALLKADWEEQEAVGHERLID